MNGDNNLPHKVVMRLSEQMCKIGQGLTWTWQLRVHCCFTWLCHYRALVLQIKPFNFLSVNREMGHVHDF